MGSGWTGLAATQLVPGIAVWDGLPTVFPVEPPTASTRADIGCWNSSCKTVSGYYSYLTYYEASTCVVE